MHRLSNFPKQFHLKKIIYVYIPLTNLSNPPAIELPYVHHIVLVLQHSSFVIIYIKIIGCGEYCDERWKASRLAFSVHTVSGVLRLVGADDGEQIVVLQELAAGCIAVVVRKKSQGTKLRYVIVEHSTS